MRAKRLYPGLSVKEAPIPYMEPSYMRQGWTLYRSGGGHNACRIKTGFFDRHRVVFDKNFGVSNRSGIRRTWWSFWRRSSMVALFCRRGVVRVYRGNGWHTRACPRSMVGFRAGEFCMPTKRSEYLVKSFRKRLKKIQDRQYKALELKAQIAFKIKKASLKKRRYIGSLKKPTKGQPQAARPKRPKPEMFKTGVTPEFETLSPGDQARVLRLVREKQRHVWLTRAIKGVGF